MSKRIVSVILILSVLCGILIISPSTAAALQNPKGFVSDYKNVTVTEKDANNSEYTSEYRVPKILLDSEDAKKANTELEDNYNKWYNAFKSISSSQPGDILGTMKKIDYEAYVDMDILSVVVEYTHFEYSFVEYDVYNFDLKTGKRIDNKSIIQNVGVSFYNMYTALAKNISQKIKSYNFTDEKKYNQKSTTKGNLDASKLYIADNKLMAVCRAYIPTVTEKVYFKAELKVTDSLINYVTDAKNELYNLKNSSNTTEQKHYCIPKILLSGNDAASVNNEILKNYEKYFSDSYINDITAETAQKSIYYNAYLNKDVLSVVITNEFPNNQLIEYDIYNFNVKTGKRLYNDDIRGKFGISKERINKGIYNGILSKCNALTVEYNKFGTEWENCVKKSLSDDNINNSQLYIGKHNKLMFKCLIYQNAGVDLYYLLKVNLNAETIDLSNDIWNFTNSHKYFGEDEYDISTGDYIKLVQGLSNDEIVEIMQDKDGYVWNKEENMWKYKGWAGSCFGMSSAVVLGYENKININSFDSQYNTFREAELYKNSKGDTDVGTIESMINFYQLRLHIDNIQTKLSDFEHDKYSSFEESNNLEKLVNEFTVNPNPHVIELAFMKNGEKASDHAVVGYNFSDEGNGKYEFSVYDCSIGPDKVFKVNISENNGFYSKKCDEWIAAWKNKDDIFIGSAMSAEDLMSANILVAPSTLNNTYVDTNDNKICRIKTNYGSFTVSDGKSETVIVNGSVYSGDLNVKSLGKTNEAGFDDEYEFILPDIAESGEYKISEIKDDKSYYSTAVDYNDKNNGFFVSSDSVESGTVTVNEDGTLKTSYSKSTPQIASVTTNLAQTDWYTVKAEGSSSGLTLDPDKDKTKLYSDSESKVNLSVNNIFNSLSFKDVALSGNVTTVQEGTGDFCEIINGGKTVSDKLFGYSVVFDSKGGTNVDTYENIKLNSKVNAPEEPTKEGFKFAGWFKDEDTTNKWDFDTDVVKADTVLYAGWKEPGDEPKDPDDPKDPEVVLKDNGEYKYIILDDGTVEIKKYKGSASDLVIPDTIDGRKVTSIGYIDNDNGYCAAFEGNSSIKSVTIPEGINYMSPCMFKDCTNLTTVNYNAVYGKTIPYFESYEEVYYGNLFGGCEKLNKINFGKKVRVIPERMFSNLNGIKLLQIPENVREISNRAFENCKNLETVQLSNGVSIIGNYAFEGCENLRSISGSDNNNTLSIGFEAFTDTAWLKNKSDGIVYFANVAYTYKGKCPSSIKLKYGIKGIASGAFANQSKLSKINIPDTVIRIGAYAFGDTAWYKNKKSGIIYIGKMLYGFKSKYDSENGKYKSDCPSKVTVKSGIKGIADSAFEGCGKLSGISLPTSLKGIGNNAFKESGLTKITLPNYFTSIGNNAFYGSKLTSITIPPSVKRIGSTAIGYTLGYMHDSDTGEDDIEVFAGKTKDFTIKCYNGTEGELYAKCCGFDYSYKESISLKAGGNSYFAAADSSDVKFSSSKKSVARIYDEGKIVALKKGSAYVSAVCNGNTYKFKVKVTSSPKIKVGNKKFSSKKWYSVKKGKKLTVKISGKADGVNNSYKSSKKKTAKVISNKKAKTVKIKGYRRGKATVTIKVNGVKFKIKVRVK